MSGEIDVRLRGALEELDRYLADLVAPLLVADEIETLTEFPPELTAEALNAWALTQFRLSETGETLADLLFHAIKKIQAFEEFNLLPQEKFVGFLADVADHLLSVVPPAEQERLVGMLAYLREGRGAGVPTVQNLRRAVPAGAARVQRAAEESSTPLTPEELRSLRRFSLLFDRLGAGKEKGGDGEQGGKVDDESARQLLVLAAAGATTAGDLQSRMAQLQGAGVGPAFARDLVRSLSAAIPDWVVRNGQSVEVVRGESVEAVRRAVKLAGDGARTTERWKDLLKAAAESFNQGAYARAVTLLDLADRMVAEKEREKHVADIARGNAHEAFEPMRLLQATSDPQQRPLVRRLVEFFPVWSVRELLDALVFQPDSKLRRLYLALVEVWGEEAYQPVVERLATSIAETSRDPNIWWYQRNLVYLLHRLPRPESVDPRQVLELSGPFSALERPPSFQRETFILLGQLPNALGAPLLMQRLSEAERALAGTAQPPHDLREMEKILNALAAALAKSGSPAARRALVDHALAQRQRTGDSPARLRELAVVDLAGDRELLARLLETARGLQPRKLLGFVVSRNEETLADVVRALAGTSDPAVRRFLSELTQRFPEREFGRLAAVALAGDAGTPAPEAVDESEVFLPPPPSEESDRPRSSLSGDLAVFGLPGLLQSFQQSETSGHLVLRRENGSERASLDLVEGKLAECRCGGLSGETAFYQIFEMPSPGTFEFEREDPTANAVKPRGQELMGLLMEAMRRFDEFQRLRALVPDEARLVAGEAKPSAPEGEQDGELMRRLWTRIRGGAQVLELDAISLVDAFRARSMLAHWLEEGAVRFTQAPPSAPPPRGDAATSGA